ncbi:hypothetical protein AVEN_207938-1 [Araneus ventricosus]|uniref:Uncharacterized protein n=1 Tax=Araneus ventricosus TaxID=182803 RepID=A0A4Y2JDV8_ARAVE|nr:hypothetical protein AVEN_207938-1 [Araneus ventricosus]
MVDRMLGATPHWSRVALCKRVNLSEDLEKRVFHWRFVIIILRKGQCFSGVPMNEIGNMRSSSSMDKSSSILTYSSTLTFESKLASRSSSSFSFFSVVLTVVTSLVLKNTAFLKHFRTHPGSTFSRADVVQEIASKPDTDFANSSLDSQEEICENTCLRSSFLYPTSKLRKNP